MVKRLKTQDKRPTDFGFRISDFGFKNHFLVQSNARRSLFGGRILQSAIIGSVVLGLWSAFAHDLRLGSNQWPTQRVSPRQNRAQDSRKIKREDEPIYTESEPNLVKPKLLTAGSYITAVKFLPRHFKPTWEAEISFVVDVDGRPRDTKVVKSSGNSAADAAAIDYVMSMRYEPGRLDGRAVRVRWMSRIRWSSGPAPSAVAKAEALIKGERKTLPHGRATETGSPRSPEKDSDSDLDLTLARHFIAQQDWNFSLERLLSVYQHDPTYPAMDEVLFLLGDALEKLKSPSLAAQVYRQLLEDKPDAERARLAAERLKTIENKRGSGASPETKSEITEGPVISLESKLVEVPVIVRDTQGRFVDNLQKQDFSLWEDKQPQDIAFFSGTDDPISIALLLDTSGSTWQHRLQIADAASAFLKVLRPQDHLMVLAFDERLHLVRTLAPNADDLKMRDLLEPLPPGPSTRFYDALALAALKTAERGAGRKAVVVLSDGVDTASRSMGRRQIAQFLEEVGIPVFVIHYRTEKAMEAAVRATAGEGRGGRLESLRREYALAEETLGEIIGSTGGKLVRAEGLEVLSERFSEIAREVRSLYNLAYYPVRGDSRPGKARKIQVRVNRPGVKIHIR